MKRKDVQRAVELDGIITDSEEKLSKMERYPEKTIEFFFNDFLSIDLCRNDETTKEIEKLLKTKFKKDIEQAKKELEAL